jgi:hypothetical protein
MLLDHGLVLKQRFKLVIGVCIVFVYVEPVASQSVLKRLKDIRRLIENSFQCLSLDVHEHRHHNQNLR